MIDPAGKLHEMAARDTVMPQGARVQPPNSQSFAATLSNVFGDAEGLRQNPALSQTNVVRQDPGVPEPSAPTPALPSSPAPPNAIAALVNAYDSGESTATPASPTPATTSTNTTTSPDSESAFDAAYWASQPPAVQQLQYVSPDDRTQLATQLANEGYSIDVPIMVWGWDPATTMATRQADGYTWVPSALQQPVAVAPGITYNGQTYNPANPPAGSITVT